MHRPMMLALAAALCAAPVLAQTPGAPGAPAPGAQTPGTSGSQAPGTSGAQVEAMRTLREAEEGLRDVLKRLEEGTLAPSSGTSRLRQALDDVERAMLRLPADSRRGAPWQTAVKEVSEAMALMRQDGVDLAAARAAAGEALATLPALAGAETSTGG